jgi:predicted O-methyltransferase YrrM
MKSIYIGIMRILSSAARAIGIIVILDKWAKKSKFGLWVRSLLSIYDLSDLVALDLPWWTFESKEIIERFLQTRSNPRVFEFGSGASTFWLARRAAEVISIEHDPIWAQKVNEMLPPNAKVILVPPETISPEATPILSRKKGFEDLDFTKYVTSIDKERALFDVIVIDGRAREQCFARALNFLSDGGVIVFDNVDRARYRKALEKYKFTVEVQVTQGLTPALPYSNRTALIRKFEFLPEPLSNFSSCG